MVDKSGSFPLKSHRSQPLHPAHTSALGKLSGSGRRLGPNLALPKLTSLRLPEAFLAEGASGATLCGLETFD